MIQATIIEYIVVDGDLIFCFIFCFIIETWSLSVFCLII